MNIIYAAYSKYIFVSGELVNRPSLLLIYYLEYFIMRIYYYGKFIADTNQNKDTAGQPGSVTHVSEVLRQQFGQLSERNLKPTSEILSPCKPKLIIRNFYNA